MSEESTPAPVSPAPPPGPDAVPVRGPAPGPVPNPVAGPAPVPAAPAPVPPHGLGPALGPVSPQVPGPVPAHVAGPGPGPGPAPGPFPGGPGVPAGTFAPAAPRPWPQRPPSAWPVDRWDRPAVPATPAVLASAGLAGILAAATLTFDRPGLDWPLVGLALAGTAVAGRAVVGPRPWRGASLGRYAWGAGALALLGVGAVRAAGWLYVWCVLLAIIAGAQALVGGRTVRAALASVFAVPVAMARALPWARYGLGRFHPRTGMAGTARLLASLGVGLLLLLIFGALFASADPAFGQLVDRVLPAADASHLPRWVLLCTLVGSVGLGTGYLASTRPAVQERDEQVGRRLRRLEWALPIALVDGLFATFVVVQLAVLFGGHRHVLETAGLTYAEYARGGFWQLLVVTGLTLAVMAAAGRWAPRVLPADRLLIRVLLGGLAALTLVIVWSALRRMSLYEQAYGYTRLRVFVTGVELWLGLLFGMILLAGVRLRARWLPRAALAAAVVGLLGLAVLNPDRFIAARNVDRYAQTGRVDLGYLSELSADAVPELTRLPAKDRSCALWRISVERDDWRTFNLARARARPIIEAGADMHGCWVQP